MTSIEQLLVEAQQALQKKSYQQAHHCLLRILQQDRHNADAYYLLSIIAFEHHNKTKALELIKRAQAIKPQAKYGVLAAKLCLLNHDHVNAKQYAEQAGELSRLNNLPKLSGPEWDDLGVIYSQIGCHQQALCCFQNAAKVFEEHKNTPSSLYEHLASAYKYCGDFQAAKTCYEKLLAVNETAYAGHWALAALAPDAGASIASLTEKLATIENIDDQLYVAHALSRKLEYQGDYDQALAVLHAPKQRKKAELAYHVDNDLALFQALEKVTKALKSSAVSEPGSVTSVEPIFVVGMPRTGTTLVERLLSQAPQVMSAGEMAHFSVAFKQLSTSQSGALLDTETVHSAKSIDWPTLGHTYLAKTRAITGDSKRFIDKMPINFLYIGFILQALPNAKIICLDRNYQDTVVSNYRQLFASDFAYYRYSYDLTDCARYCQGYYQLLDFFEHTFPENVYRLKYEALVNNPIAQGQALFEFIDEPWQSEFLDLSTNQAPVATASSTQVRTSINNTSVGAWKNYQNTLSKVLK
ncbi:sulfotransferase [Thalassotalea aquiviva]|uniref:tetratricopeptide repeat-containing sulfotransferase family protein n=1 Tax=Thalassotalea aquiviva TaxID=3242415 RepID=UPI00352B740E